MKPLAMTTVISAVLSAGAVIALAQDRPTTRPRRPRRKISWVNPKLPAVPGLSHHVLHSTAMARDVGYVVWVPAGYDAKANRRYPVIHFLHGAGGNESSDSAGFSGHVAAAIKKGVLPPVICVFANGGMSGYRGTVEKMILEELILDMMFSLPSRSNVKEVVVSKDVVLNKSNPLAVMEKAG